MAAQEARCFVVDPVQRTAARAFRACVAMEEGGEAAGAAGGEEAADALGARLHGLQVSPEEVVAASDAAEDAAPGAGAGDAEDALLGGSEEDGGDGSDADEAEDGGAAGGGSVAAPEERDAALHTARATVRRALA